MLFTIVNLSTAFTQLKYEIIYCVWYKTWVRRFSIDPKKGYPSIQKGLWGGSLWFPSYFAGSCGGAPLTVI